MKIFIYAIFFLILSSFAFSLIVMEFVPPPDLERDNLIDYEAVPYLNNYSVVVCDEFVRVANGTMECVAGHNEFRTEVKYNLVKTGRLMLGDTPINFTDRYCVKVNSTTAHCISVTDGLHWPDRADFKGCRDRGGQDCVIVQVTDGTYSLYNTNNFAPETKEVYKRGDFIYEGRR